MSIKYLLEFKKTKIPQHVIKIKGDVPLREVNYNYVTPKVIICSRIIECKSNKFNKNVSINFENSKKYFKKEDKFNFFDIINIQTCTDKKLWRGSLKTKDDFIKVCENNIDDPSGEQLYQVIYVSYPKETKQTYKKLFNQNKNITIKDFVNSKEYKCLLDYAERNARKCLTDFSTKMLYYVNTEVDDQAIKTKYDFPRIIQPQYTWRLNTIKDVDNDLYIFYNCLNTDTTDSLIKILDDKIEIIDIRLSDKYETNMKTFQVFGRKCHIYLIDKKERLNLKPKKYTSEVKGVKHLLPNLVL
jgi:hypothetical protein